MKKLHLLLLLISLSCLLFACGRFTQSTGQDPLQPGEMLGDMAVVVASSPVPHVTDYCNEEELSAGNCEVPKIGHIGIMNGWSEGTPEELEEAWSCCSWELVVDGRLVDLHEFLTETMEQEDKATRFWNVALKSPTPGRHVVRWTYGPDEPIEETWIFFVANSADFDQQ